MRINKFRAIIFAFIFINISLASRWIVDGNIFFHTDIARDFLLIEDIVDNKNLTLLGPRSGAIPGLFHGPLWLYLNVPAYILGGGNPLYVGWFWVILYSLSLFVVYYVGKEIFNEDVGLLSALLLSSVTALQVKSLFNPYGALILTPLFFYFFQTYLKNKKLKTLILALILLGLIIQFQLAFGVPILILSAFYLIYYLFKIKKLFHLFAFFTLVIPLSSYILFDLRNNFLQIKSVINYLFGTQTHGKLDLNFFQLAILRIKESVTDGLGSVTQNNIVLTSILAVLILFVFYKAHKRYFLFGYFYLGFWLMTIFFKGSLWNYYYMPFIPLLILLFVSGKNLLNKWVFYSVFLVIYFINIQTALKDILTYNSSAEEQDVATWKFNELVAKNVFGGAENEFGYFIFTPDLYGYSPRYALNFYQKKEGGKKLYPYQKRAVTYLVIAPPPVYGKDPSSIWYQKNINSKLWEENDLRITKNPESVVSFNNDFRIEKYLLTDEEIKVEPNPYLIKDIFFR